MLPTLIIVFREMIEAGLIIGIVMAATRGVPRRGLFIALGILGGVLGACLVAAGAGTIASLLNGSGQEVFNCIILAIAVLMLTWHNVWMAREGREMARAMQRFGNEVATGRRSLVAIAIVVGIAVLREGSEIVLFLYGIAVSGGNSAQSMILGGMCGLILGAGLSALMYAGLLRIPGRHLFAVTSWLIAFLAAGMASQCVVLLQQAGLVTTLSRPLWNTSGLLSNDGIAGRILHTLVGYSDRPTGMQLNVYAVTLAAIILLTRIVGRAPAAAPAVAEIGIPAPPPLRS
jgi:high-affinity iron transporter